MAKILKANHHVLAASAYYLFPKPAIGLLLGPLEDRHALTVRLYDYKNGTDPNKPDQALFDSSDLHMVNYRGSEYFAIPIVHHESRVYRAYREGYFAYEDGNSEEDAISKLRARFAKEDKEEKKEKVE